jgi:two-component system, NtrC family, sensor kinase
MQNHNSTLQSETSTSIFSLQLEDEQQKQLLRSLYDEAGYNICLVDVDEAGEFRYFGWNQLTVNKTGIASADIAGKTPEELLGESQGAIVRQNYQRCLDAGHIITYEECLPFQGRPIWWLTTLTPIRNEQGKIYRIVISTFDISDRKAIEDALNTKAKELANTLEELQRTQMQMVQSEKMSSLGQLVAGVAHEINNPVSFIYGNIAPAKDYSRDLLKLISLYEAYYPNPHPVIQAEMEAIDLEFVKDDLPQLLASMEMGADRIRQIVSSLRTFSRLDEAEYKEVDIHQGIESTLVILDHRIKAKPHHPAIQIVRQYSGLPPIECYAGQLNQVFMNILTNALDALEEQDQQRSLQEITQVPSQICICTQITALGRVQISIADNGGGIPEAIKPRIFDPFFTTKPIGKGTGMGMSISYQIITENHKGIIQCSSTGAGTEFVIEIPLRQDDRTISLARTL